MDAAVHTKIAPWTSLKCTTAGLHELSAKWWWIICRVLSFEKKRCKRQVDKLWEMRLQTKLCPAFDKQISRLRKLFFRVPAPISYFKLVLISNFVCVCVCTCCHSHLTSLPSKAVLLQKLSWSWEIKLRKTFIIENLIRRICYPNYANGDKWKMSKPFPDDWKHTNCE